MRRCIARVYEHAHADTYTHVTHHLRLQQLRGVGGNAWRTAHNPPSPSLLDLADRLGVLMLDENRVFLSPNQSANMVDLVTRDRNHPSVIFYSFCNEPGCNSVDGSAPTQPTLAFKNAVEEHDGTRGVTANMCVKWGTCPKEAQYLDRHQNSTFDMPSLLDVQGFSHVTDSIYRVRWGEGEGRGDEVFVVVCG